MGPTSGAVIHFVDLPGNTSPKPEALFHWIQGFPFLPVLAGVDLRGALPVVMSRVLMALTEPCRLEPAEPRILAATATELRLWLPIDDGPGAGLASQFICRWFDGAFRGSRPSSEDVELCRAFHSRRWNQTHAHLARAAGALGVPFFRIERAGQQFLQLGQGARRRLLHETLTDRTSLFAKLFHGKEALHQVLAGHGFPLPRQRIARTRNQAMKAADELGWPVVLKPAEGGKGKGVWVGLDQREALERAWQVNAGDGSTQLVQEVLPGHDHRLLICDGEVMAVARRHPAEVCGDGLRCLDELIRNVNDDPRRGVAYERLMNRIPLDERLEAELARQGLTLASVPTAGRRVQLSRTANISQGGGATDVTDRLHADNRRLALDVASLLGTDVLGLDVMALDVGRSWTEGGLRVLEANLSPGLRPHLVADPSSDLCRRLVLRWTGGPEAARIPTALVTGSIGKTTTTRMLAHVMRGTRRRVAFGSTSGSQLDDLIVNQEDSAHGGTIRRFLQDPRVEAVVGEVSRGGLLKGGLRLFEADVGAILNILDAHLGEDGVSSREDLLQIKSLVARAATRALVLNADDPLLRGVYDRQAACEHCLVGSMPAHGLLLDHLAAGGLAALWSDGPDGVVVLRRGDTQLCKIPAADIRAAWGGLCRGTVVSAAFVAVMAERMGVAPDLIRERILGFDASLNPGRAERIESASRSILLSWAGSPEALQALAVLLESLRSAQKSQTRILLRVGFSANDRWLCSMAAEACRLFDVVRIARGEKLAGRVEDEVAAMVLAAGRAADPTVDLRYVGEVHAAIPAFLDEAAPGDAVLVHALEVHTAKTVILESLRTEPIGRSSHLEA